MLRRDIACQVCYPDKASAGLAGWIAAASFKGPVGGKVAFADGRRSLVPARGTLALSAASGSFDARTPSGGLKPCAFY